MQLRKIWQRKEKKQSPPSPTRVEVEKAVDDFLNIMVGEQVKRAINTIGGVFNDYAKKQDERTSQLEIRLKQAEGIYQDQSIVKIMDDVMKKVRECLPEESEREVKKRVPEIIRRHLQTKEGQKAVISTTHAIVAEVENYTHTPEFEEAVKTRVRNYLHAPEFKEIIKEPTKQVLREVASEDFMKKVFKELKEEGLPKTLKMLVGKYSLSGLAILALVGTSGFLYTSYVTKNLIKKVERETDVQRISGVSKQVDDLSLSLEQYSNRISELDKQNSNLAGKVSALEQELLVSKARGDNFEYSLLETRLNFGEYQEAQLDTLNAQAKQNAGQNEKLTFLEEDIKSYRLKVTADLARLNAKIEPLETAVQSLTKDSGVKWNSYDADRAVYQKTTAETEELVNSVRGLRQEYNSLKDSYSGLKDSQSAKDVSLNAVKREINSISKKIEDIEKRLGQVQEE